jgi:autotransporter-associated beta strand protein
LTGANTYTGGTTLSAGTLTLGNNSALGSGTLSMAAGTSLSWLGSSNFTIGNKITIASGSNFVPPTGTTQTISGIISDGATPGTLNKLGPGTLVLSGANAYTGSTLINAGTLALVAGGSIASSNLVGVNGGGTFDISAGGNQTVQNLAGGFGPGIVNLGVNTLTDVNTGGNLFQGKISGSGGLTLQGSGSLTLNNVSTYTGATTINGGTLALVTNGSIAASSGINLAAAGATFDASGLGGTTVTIKDLSGVGGSSLNLGPASLVVGTANSTTFGGVISGVTPINGLTKQGTGTLTLTGANTYIGPTNINAGTLALGPGGSIASSNQVSIGAAGGTLDISSGGNQTVQNLANANLGSVRLGANTLTDNTTNVNIFDGVISGTGGLPYKVRARCSWASPKPIRG